jgi:hypothetical protein
LNLQLASFLAGFAVGIGLFFALMIWAVVAGGNRDSEGGAR